VSLKKFFREKFSRVKVLEVVGPIMILDELSPGFSMFLQQVANGGRCLGNSALLAQFFDISANG